MLKLLVLCGTILCLSMTAAAQDAPAAFDASSPAGEPAAPVTFHPSSRAPWQLGIGYQYQHFGALGQTFHTNGLNTDITGYLNNWLGVEGTAVVGFGRTTTTPTFVAKTFFIGGGPHIAIPTQGRFEPWAHLLVGWEHFRFAQTSTVGSNSALGLMGGGGVDFKLGSRLYWRAQVDYIGTRFQSAMQSNYSFGTGLVLNF
jgi:hypothetical protein